MQASRHTHTHTSHGINTHITHTQCVCSWQRTFYYYYYFAMQLGMMSDVYCSGRNKNKIISIIKIIQHSTTTYTNEWYHYIHYIHFKISTIMIPFGGRSCVRHTPTCSSHSQILATFRTIIMELWACLSRHTGWQAGRQAGKQAKHWGRQTKESKTRQVRGHPGYHSHNHKCEWWWQHLNYFPYGNKCCCT